MVFRFRSSPSLTLRVRRFYASPVKRFVLLAASVMVFTSGCATQSPHPISARRRAYERLLSFIEPGMTRRQIYALLPPRRTPSALPPSVFAVAGIPIYAHHSELHSLDADFSLFVQYRVANRREYPSRWLPLPNAPNALDRLLHGGVLQTSGASPPSKTPTTSWSPARRFAAQRFLIPGQSSSSRRPRVSTTSRFPLHAKLNPNDEAPNSSVKRTFMSRLRFLCNPRLAAAHSRRLPQAR
jgi:hypothetical protein